MPHLGHPQVGADKARAPLAVPEYVNGVSMQRVWRVRPTAGLLHDGDLNVTVLDGTQSVRKERVGRSWREPGAGRGSCKVILLGLVVAHFGPVPRTLDGAVLNLGSAVTSHV